MARPSVLTTLVAVAESRRPSTDDAVAGLQLYARRSATALVRAVRAGRIGACWSSVDDATGHLLGATGWARLGPASTFLDVPPDRWATFSEPQITGGWAHFLGSRNRLARCQAMIDVAWRGRPDPRPGLVGVELLEAERGRTDFLLIATDGGGRRLGLCIEAKLGHVVTNGQLDGYERYLEQSHDLRDPFARCLMIVAPTMRPDIAGQLARRGNEWGYSSWKDWLIDYDGALPAAADDHDFRRFRHTTLHRSAMELDR